MVVTVSVSFKRSLPGPSLRNFRWRCPTHSAGLRRTGVERCGTLAHGNRECLLDNTSQSGCKRVLTIGQPQSCAADSQYLAKNNSTRRTRDRKERERM